MRLGIVRREDGLSIVELFEGVLWVEGIREGLEGVLMGGVAFGGRGFVWLLVCLVRFVVSCMRAGVSK